MSCTTAGSSHHRRRQLARRLLHARGKAWPAASWGREERRSGRTGTVLATLTVVRGISRTVPIPNLCRDVLDAPLRVDSSGYGCCADTEARMWMLRAD